MDVTSAAEVFVDQLRATRRAKGWSQAQLAQRLGDMGLPMHQTTVAKIETREKKVTLNEALAFSAALDVSPVALIAPREESEVVAVTPELVMEGGLVADWIAGLRLPLLTPARGKGRSPWPPRRELDPPVESHDKRFAFWMSERSERELRAFRLPYFSDLRAALTRLLETAGDPDLNHRTKAIRTDATEDLRDAVAKLEHDAGRLRAALDEQLTPKKGARRGKH